MAILNKHATVSVPVVLIIKILPTAKSSFKDPYLNNTVVIINRGQTLTRNCRVSRIQGILYILLEFKKKLKGN
jgi:hypothetical protein